MFEQEYTCESYVHHVTDQQYIIEITLYPQKMIYYASVSVNIKSTFEVAKKVKIDNVITQLILTVHLCDRNCSFFDTYQGKLKY
jgi:hypothetical protein